MGDSSDTAAFLATTSGALDRLARDDSVWADDERFAMGVAYTARGFLDAFALAMQSTVPKLASFRRDRPVRHAGISASSYHELACRIALQQFLAVWQRISPEERFAACEQPRSSEFDGISGSEVGLEIWVQEWDSTRSDLARLFADVDPPNGEWLCAGIDTERLPQRSVESELERQILAIIDEHKYVSSQTDLLNKANEKGLVMAAGSVAPQLSAMKRAGTLVPWSKNRGYRRP